MKLYFNRFYINWLKVGHEMKMLRREAWAMGEYGDWLTSYVLCPLWWILGAGFAAWFARAKYYVKEKA